MNESRETSPDATLAAAEAKRRAAEAENAGILLRLREATIAHLENLLKIRDAELEAAAARLREYKARAAGFEAPRAKSWAGLSPSEKIAACLETIDGWCTPAKAQWLARLVIERKAARVLEIGVFGGKSLIPMALAAQSLGGARVVGVEPWRADVAIAEPTNAVNDEWWANVDFAAIKARFFANAARYGVLPEIAILETDSESALALFERSRETFDLVHIDGAHSPQRALRDAMSWSQLVRPGGLIVFDDIEWPSVRLARAYLKETFRVVDEVVEGNSSYGAYEKA